MFKTIKEVASAIIYRKNWANKLSKKDIHTLNKIPEQIMVSICVPTYNTPLKTLEKCIYSILAQDYNEYEIIISDDSSNDSVKNFISKIKDSRIRYYRNERPFGSPKNWNEAIKKAQGKYIKIMHHDDMFFAKNALSKMVAMMNKNKNCNIGFTRSVDIYFSPYRYTHRRTKKYINKIKKDCLCLFLRTYFSTPSCCIFKNKQNTRFDENTKWFVDIDLYITEILKNNSQFAYCNEELVAIIGDKNNVSSCYESDFELQTREALYCYKKFKKFIKQSKYKKEIEKSIKNLYSKIKNKSNIDKDNIFFS